MNNSSSASSSDPIDLQLRINVPAAEHVPDAEMDNEETNERTDTETDIDSTNDDKESAESDDEIESAPVIKLNPASLKVGDIIVFKNHYYKVYGDASKGYDDEQEPYVDHISIVTKVTGNDSVELTHAVISDDGYYNRNKLSGVCTSFLKSFKGQKQDEGTPEQRMFDISFHAYRFADEQLIAKAVEVALQQTEYRIPYDPKRLDAKIKCEDELGWGDDDFLEDSLKQYQEAHQKEENSGKYKALKYALRYPLPIMATSEDGIGKGVTCAMFVILAFQIAEFHARNLLKPCDKWVDTSEDLVHKYWNSEVSFNEFTHTTFPLNAELTGAGGICAYMEQGHGWKKLGEVAAPDIPLTPQARGREKARRHFFFDQSMNKWNTIVEKCPEIIKGNSKEALPRGPSADPKYRYPQRWFGIMQQRARDGRLDDLSKLPPRSQ